MGVSLGIGPFRFYSSRRRRRKPMSSNEAATGWLVALGILLVVGIYAGIKALVEHPMVALWGSVGLVSWIALAWLSPPVRRASVAAIPTLIAAGFVIGIVALFAVMTHPAPPQPWVGQDSSGCFNNRFVPVACPPWPTHPYPRN